MNRNTKVWVWALVVFSVIVVVVGGYVFLNKSSNPSPNDAMTSMNEPKNTNAPSGTGAEEIATSTVDIKDFAFSPSVIKIKVGTTVTWTNRDSAEHSVVADEASTDAPNGPLLKKGKSYSFKFTQVGNFAYHCGVHPNMSGTVVVSQ